MPELPEVETIARGLAGFVGKRISRVELGPHDWVRAPPPSPAAHLEGRRITSIGRHGKQLLLHLEGKGRLVIHLGMSGRVETRRRGDPVPVHTHLRLAFHGTGTELRFRDPRRFGGAWILARDGRGVSIPARPGPDALAVRLPEFRELLRRDRRIKALLLDQQAIAGIGNIYCDEALFAARIHPMARASGLRKERVQRLHRALRRILLRAIRDGGSTLRDYRDADGAPGRFQRIHRVYGREGEPCTRCGATIVRIQVAGRSSHVCRRCQRAPRTP